MFNLSGNHLKPSKAAGPGEVFRDMAAIVGDLAADNSIAYPHVHRTPTVDEFLTVCHKGHKDTIASKFRESLTVCGGEKSSLFKQITILGSLPRASLVWFVNFGAGEYSSLPQLQYYHLHYHRLGAISNPCNERDEFVPWLLLLVYLAGRTDKLLSRRDEGCTRPTLRCCAISMIQLTLTSTIASFFHPISPSHYRRRSHASEPSQASSHRWHVPAAQEQRWNCNVRCDTSTLAVHFPGNHLILSKFAGPGEVFRDRVAIVGDLAKADTIIRIGLPNLGGRTAREVSRMQVRFLKPNPSP